MILSCQASGFLAAAVALDEARLQALDASVDLPAVRRHLAAIVAICQRRPGQRADWPVADPRTAFTG